MASPHDKLFKATFSEIEHARSVLASALPSPLAALVVWDSLELVPGEFVDGRLANMQSDLLFRAQLGQRDACIYVLFEHQSTVDRAMPLRLLRYMTRIWERFEREGSNGKLPAILPVVLHHGETGWTSATRFGDLLDLDEHGRDALAEFIPDFGFVLDDLSTLDDAALRARALTDLARLVLVVFSRCRRASDPVAVLRPWVQTMLAVLGAPSGLAALSMVARYIVEVSEGLPEELGAFLAELGPGTEEGFMTMLDRLTEQALERGRREATADVLLRLLTRRFGPLPADARAKVDSASAAELDRWTERLLDARTLDDALA